MLTKLFGKRKPCVFCRRMTRHYLDKYDIACFLEMDEGSAPDIRVPACSKCQMLESWESHKKVLSEAIK